MYLLNLYYFDWKKMALRTCHMRTYRINLNSIFNEFSLDNYWSIIIKKWRVTEKVVEGYRGRNVFWDQKSPLFRLKVTAEDEKARY